MVEIIVNRPLQGCIDLGHSARLLEDAFRQYCNEEPELVTLSLGIQRSGPFLAEPRPRRPIIRTTGDFLRRFGARRLVKGADHDASNFKVPPGSWVFSGPLVRRRVLQPHEVGQTDLPPATESG